MLQKPDGAVVLFPESLRRREAFRLFGSAVRHWGRRESTSKTSSVDIDLVQSLREGLKTLEVGATDHTRLAMLVGEDNPYRKVVVAAIGGGGEVLTYVKVPLTEEAQERLHRERNILNSFRDTQLARRAPHVLGLIRTTLGEGLVLTPIKGRRGPRQLGPGHARWYASTLATSGQGRYLDTGTWQSIESDATKVRNMLGPAGAAHALRMQQTIDQLTEMELPIGLAHGDFTPWNTRFIDGEIMAIDWEAVILDAPPLYDLFYHAMTRQLSKLPSLGPWDRRVEVLCRRNWPDLSQHYPVLRQTFLLCATNEFASARELRPSRPPGPVWRWLSSRFEES